MDVMCDISCSIHPAARRGRRNVTWCNFSFSESEMWPYASHHKIMKHKVTWKDAGQHGVSCCGMMLRRILLWSLV